MSYLNINKFIVIAEANRNATTSFYQHRKRGSLGGVDCVAAVGTPILAPADCTIRNIPDNGTGGNTVHIIYKNSAYGVDQMMHLDRFVNGGEYAQGEVIGYSGDSAAPGQPHVHWHKLGNWYNDEWGATNRYNPFNYFTSPAGIIQKEIDNMPDGFSFVKDAQSDTIYAVNLDTGKRVGIGSPTHKTLLERVRKNNADDPMLVIELDIVASYLALIGAPDADPRLFDAINRIAVDKDVVKDAVSAALAEGIDVTTSLSDADADRIAKLFAIRLAGGQVG